MSSKFLVPVLAPTILSSWTTSAGSSAASFAPSSRGKAKRFFYPLTRQTSITIEQPFAKMKTLLRKADARIIDAIRRTFGALLDCFTPKECAIYSETRTRTEGSPGSAPRPEHPNCDARSSRSQWQLHVDSGRRWATVDCRIFTASR